jgi:hypothetical protein
MSSDPKSASSDTKKLIPILVIIGVLMCGCIVLPVVGGMALIGFFSLRLHGEVERGLDEAQAVDLRLDEMPGEMMMPALPEMPSDLGGAAAGGAKQIAYQQMLAAAEELDFAQRNYDAAQGVYEQQRDFANSQAGRLGAQGIRLPPPMPPDPSLYQAVLAAQQRYDAAKAAYESLP